MNLCDEMGLVFVFWFLQQPAHTLLIFYCLLLARCLAEFLLLGPFIRYMSRLIRVFNVMALRVRENIARHIFGNFTPALCTANYPSLQNGENNSSSEPNISDIIGGILNMAAPKQKVGLYSMCFPG